ncbi:hypothetical protein NEHOM01_0564 [Nematocida homosporus]|uniref:uncharacterized protein n=1 Tax=Nematocida homosporus TaxID=1912981 RepID=UPI00222053AE|nr:uncharacterized protein NEHOM01_0564 [Nematocida homosporus]KAI5185059.1 hypothetical protein NEHOM01_0564 [Nematocida homosporus]
MDVLYEAISLEVSVETKDGALVKGILLEVSQRADLKLLLHNATTTLIPATNINTIRLPKILTPIITHP